MKIYSVYWLGLGFIMHIIGCMPSPSIQIKAFYQEGKYLLSQNEVTKAMQAGDSSQLIIYYKGLNHLQLDEYSLAVSTFKSLIKKEGIHYGEFQSSVLMHQGIALYHLQKNEEAIECINKAISIDSTYIEAHHNLGNIYFHIGRPVKAIQQFDQVILKDTINGKSIYRERAIAYLQLKKFEAALTDISKWTIIFGPSPEADFLVGMVYFQKDQFEMANEHFLKAVQKDSVPAEYFLQLGNSYLALEDIKNALQSFERGLAIAPEDPLINERYEKLKYLTQQPEHINY